MMKFVNFQVSIFDEFVKSHSDSFYTYNTTNLITHILIHTNSTTLPHFEIKLYIFERDFFVGIKLPTDNVPYDSSNENALV